MPTKEVKKVTKKTLVKAKKPAAAKPKAVKHVAEEVAVEAPIKETPAKTVKAHIPAGKYTFATGHRKTAIANVRLFSGKHDSLVNKKPFATYFSFPHFQEQALQPLRIAGLESDFHFSASISGGGIHSQAQALQHAISQALVLVNPELRLVMRKNGFLTRDDRKKERKKPGLKRARRAPQWAKR